jgi:hypothetical protein
MSKLTKSAKLKRITKQSVRKEMRLIEWKSNFNKIVQSGGSKHIKISRFTESKTPILLTLNRIENLQELNIPDSQFTNNGTKISQLSGFEPKFSHDKWNIKNNIKSTHNCYAYVLNKISARLKGKPQPGYFSGHSSLRYVDYNCQTFLKRLKKDNPLLYKSTFNKPCKKGYHKGFLALDTKQSNTDYHFYRQDKSGTWSHKPGQTDATTIDASNNIITIPHNADRNYKHYKYNTPCFYFCVNPKLTRSHSKHN